MSSPCGCKTTGHEPDCWMLRQTNLVEPPSEATWRGLPQSRHEGFWFTVDSLAAALHATCEQRWRDEDARNPGIDQSLHFADAHVGQASAIIKAAKEASE